MWALPVSRRGSPEFCFSCAHSTMEPLADLDDRCQVCDQTYVEGESTCKNPVCRMSQAVVRMELCDRDALGDSPAGYQRL